MIREIKGGNSGLLERMRAGKYEGIKAICMLAVGHVELPTNIQQGVQLNINDLHVLKNQSLVLDC